MGRDLVWDAIYTAATKLTRQYPHDTLKIRAVRRRSHLRWVVIEGFAIEDTWTDVFEPVRKRPLLSGRWDEVQPVQLAASNVGRFMRERPDLG